MQLRATISQLTIYQFSPGQPKYQPFWSASKMMTLQGTFLTELTPGGKLKTNEEALINSKTTTPERTIHTSKNNDIRYQLPFTKLHKLTKEQERLKPLQNSS